MTKMKKYDSFIDWKNDQSSENKTLISSLEKLVGKIAPQLTLSVKWGQACFLDVDQHVMYIHAASDYIQLGFYIGSTLKDPEKLLEGKGKYVRYIAIKSKDDIDEEKFKELVMQVI